MFHPRWYSGVSSAHSSAIHIHILIVDEQNCSQHFSCVLIKTSLRLISWLMKASIPHASFITLSICASLALIMENYLHLYLVCTIWGHSKVLCSNLIWCCLMKVCSPFTPRGGDEECHLQLLCQFRRLGAMCVNSSGGWEVKGREKLGTEKIEDEYFTYQSEILT